MSGDPTRDPIDGYYTDSDYLPTWQPELAPAWLDHVATWAGLAAPRPQAGAPFRYCEVGCGLGWTLNLLAAANPEGSFVGIDAMPEQIARARAVARAAGLENVRFVRATLDEVRHRRFPRFHYVAAHGLYTWISDRNAALLFELAARVLAPGGLCYLAYNVEPGWSALRPVQQLLSSATRYLPAASATASIEQALGLLDQVRSAAGERLGLGARAGSQLDYLRSLPKAYLGHEFLNAHWRPVFVTEAHARAQRAGLDFVDSARPRLRHADYLLRREQRALIAAQPAGPLRELVKDVCLGQMFRADVFVKSARTVSLFEARRRRTTSTFALAVAPKQVDYAVSTPAGRLRFDTRPVRALVRALAAGPCRPVDVARRAPRHGCRMSELLAAVELLLFTGALTPVDPRKRAPRAPSLNALLRAHAGAGSNPASGGQAPQVGRHGGALRVTPLELLLLSHADARPPGLRAMRALLAARGADSAQALPGGEETLRECLRHWPARRRWLHSLGVR